ncbi:hypothetical protein F5Y13DRAFT_187705 [Hypoxylon sp. FL1857]|nr:hypothetical protein F5Y13DRAFT_187705 [Hypoxylon sp. FL1857]
MPDTTSTFEALKRAHEKLSTMTPGQKVDHVEDIDHAIKNFRDKVLYEKDKKKCKVIEGQITKLEELLDEAKRSPRGWDFLVDG